MVESIYIFLPRIYLCRRSLSSNFIHSARAYAGLHAGNVSTAGSLLHNIAGVWKATWLAQEPARRPGGFIEMAGRIVP